LKVIGFSSGTVGRSGNVDRMVKTIMDKSGHENEFVKLTDLVYSGCKGCSWLCAKPQVCILKDDLFPYYQMIKEADAIIVGSPVYSGGINAAALAFLERFHGYYHVTRAIQDKPFVGVVCGYRTADAAVEQLRYKLRRVKLLDVVEYASCTPPCVRCGRHQECSIGGLYQMIGEEAHSMEITPEVFHRWEDDPDTVTAVEAAATKLRYL
jgi:hypothetical protein